MSLAGKILTVLVTLMLLVCIWLSAQVAQLNRNWGQAIEVQKTEVAKQTADLTELRTNAVTTSKRLLTARANTEHALRLARQGLEDLATRSARFEESRLRSELLLGSANSINATLEGNRERRQNEKAELLASLETTYSDLDRLSAENDRLIARATELRDRFATVLAENQKMLEQAKSSRPPAVGLR